MEDIVRRKIIDATFEILTIKDMNSISVREITKKADVNVAAISYYFGGKEALFASMMEEYWSDQVELSKEILQEEKLTKSKAKEFCLRFFKKEMQSTGILRSEQIMYQNFQVDEKTKERLDLQFRAFQHIIKSCNPNLTDLQVQIEIISILSSLTHPAMWSEISGEIVKDVEPFMEAYVNHLIDKI